MTSDCVDAYAWPVAFVRWLQLVATAGATVLAVAAVVWAILLVREIWQVRQR